MLRKLSPHLLPLYESYSLNVMVHVTSCIIDLTNDIPPNPSPYTTPIYNYSKIEKTKTRTYDLQFFVCALHEIPNLNIVVTIVCISKKSRYNLIHVHKLTRMHDTCSPYIIATPKINNINFHHGKYF